MKTTIKALYIIITIGFITGCESDSSSPSLFDPIDDMTIQDNGPTDTGGSEPLSAEEILAQTLSLPTSNFNYTNPDLPMHFTNENTTELDNTPTVNRITNDGATLGRVLFYDKKMSANNSIACASCHLQEKGFTDPDQFSTGFEGGLTGRNSMGLSNARYYENGAFFWDERAATLEDQVLMPIQDHVEMGMTLEELVPKLQAEDYYHILFERAFGDSIVTSERISLALSQFVRSIVSYQSKYDRGLEMARGNAQNGLPNFSALENLGMQLFNGPNCGVCHTTPLQIGIGAQNNGLDAQTTDEGLGAVTGDPRDDGKFKSPSLRNIGVTGPYMHDGRFATLAEVVEHYNSGVQAHPNLDPRLRAGGPGGPMNNQPRRLNLTEEEKQALVAFLETLTDEVLLTDEKFSDPFIDQD